MKPYAQGKRWTLWHADCLDVLAAGLIPADAAIVSDVPYGMDYDTDSRRFTGGKGSHVRVRPRVHGDDRPFDPAPWLTFERVVLWGYHHFAARLPVGSVLVWLKKSDSKIGAFLSDAELAWMKGGYGVYVKRGVWDGCARDEENGEHYHPTQKPVSLMGWCINKAKVPAGGLVVDPYAGSGSTGVAALASGRRFYGVETEAAYLPIIARRLAQAESDGVQGTLFGAA